MNRQWSIVNGVRMTFAFIEPIAQLVLAVVLGALIGIERDIAGKRAGMRTHALVALGAAAFVISATLLNRDVVGTAIYDPVRIAASVVAGVGFIGAGVIVFREEISVLRGVTTAAGVWVAAAVGMAAGFGFYTVAIATAVLTLIVFRLLWYVEDAIERRYGQPPTSSKRTRHWQ